MAGSVGAGNPSHLPSPLTGPPRGSSPSLLGQSPQAPPISQHQQKSMQHNLLQPQQVSEVNIEEQVICLHFLTIILAISTGAIFGYLIQQPLACQLPVHSNCSSLLQANNDVQMSKCVSEQCKSGRSTPNIGIDIYTMPIGPLIIYSIRFFSQKFCVSHARSGMLLLGMLQLTRFSSSHPLPCLPTNLELVRQVSGAKTRLGFAMKNGDAADLASALTWAAEVVNHGGQMQLNKVCRLRQHRQNICLLSNIQ